MPAYKDKKNGTWYVNFYYRDWTGTRKKKLKRGFKTKREAVAWEDSFLTLQAEELDMTFAEFVKIYERDLRSRLRVNTWNTKSYIIEHKLLPFFGKKKMNAITPSDIINWQNTMMLLEDEKGNQIYCRNYLKTIQAQLSAIFNHAVRLYSLKKNPVHAVGPIGTSAKPEEEKQIWTVEEYKAFSEAIADNVESHVMFELLFWSGMRLGEALALTMNDLDFENCTISISKSLQRINGESVITPPKTRRGVRTVTMPCHVMNELKIFTKMQYGLKDSEQIFSISKGQLHHELDRGCKISGVKRIRIHDLRHSHISLLVTELKFSPVEVASRVGHENIRITMSYAHSTPEKQNEIVNKLEKLV